MLIELTLATPDRPTRRRRWVPVVALALALGLLATACGDDDDTGTGPASMDEDAAGSGGNAGGDQPADGDDATDPFDAALRYAKCMRDHGIDMPDPTPQENGEFSLDLPAPEGMSKEELDAAEAECRPILEEARPEREPLSPDELAERRDQAVALAECMRERGHDFPDPVVGDDGGIQQQVPPGLGPGAPGFDEFEDDLAACQEAAGLEGPGDGGTTSQSGDGSEAET